MSLAIPETKIRATSWADDSEDRDSDFDYASYDAEEVSLGDESTNDACTNDESTEWSCVPCEEDEITEFCVPCVEEEVLDIATFKTHRCTGDGPASHDSKCCTMYHHRYDKRRDPSGYSPEPCEHEFLQDQGSGALIADDHVICPFGDQCTKCHNIVELLYHPQVFKRRLCMDMLDKNCCPRGALCGFAHSRAELEAHATVFSPEEEQNPSQDFFMYRYKTQWCPLPGVHDWDACIYAHTKRDMRRTPNAGYSTRRCPDWEKSLAAEPKDGPQSAYEMCCPRGSGCHMAHGVKEVLYHPAVYRMKMCSGANSCRGPRRNCCAFAHSTEELRSTSKPIIIDKKMRQYAVQKEQPQFFVPLTFASFKDSVVQPKTVAQPMPHTPSPQTYHREIPCATQESPGYCTGQALQQAFQSQSQNDSRCPPMPYGQGQQQFMPNQEANSNASMYRADKQANWIDDPRMKMSAPPCNVMPMPAQSGFVNQASQPGMSVPSGWKYAWDAQGNMHMWPDNANTQQGSSTMRSCYDSAGNIHVWPESPQDASYMEGSPNAAPYSPVNQTGAYPGSPCETKLRSDTMGSWGSSTAAPSTAINSSADNRSLRSESLGSSSGFSDSTIHPADQMPKPPSSGLLGKLRRNSDIFKEKLKAKPRTIAPRRFV